MIIVFLVLINLGSVCMFWLSKIMNSWLSFDRFLITFSMPSSNFVASFEYLKI